MATQVGRSGRAALVLALCFLACASVVAGRRPSKRSQASPSPTDVPSTTGVCASKPCGVTGSTTCSPDPADPTKAVCGCAFGWENYNPVIKACSDIDECASGVGAALCGMNMTTRCTNAPKAGDPPICGCIYGYEDFNYATKTCGPMSPCRGNPCGTGPGVTCTPTSLGTGPYNANAFVCGCAPPNYANYDNATKTCTNLVPTCPGVNNIATQIQPGVFTCLACPENNYWVNQLLACKRTPCATYFETVIDNGTCVDYDWINGYNIQGTTINTVVLGPTTITTRNFCADLCQRTALCTFYVYNNATRLCSLKKDPLAGLPAGGSLVSQVSANDLTGFVAPSAGAIGPRYLCYPNVEISPLTATGGPVVPTCTNTTLYPNNKISGLADEAACAAKCDNDCGCYSYTWYPATPTSASTMCNVNYIKDFGKLDAYVPASTSNHCWRLMY